MGQRPVRERVAIALWLLWAVFVAAPLFVGVIVFEMSRGDMLGFLSLVPATGFIGCLAQFVVFGYGNPIRLFQYTAGDA